MKTHPWPVVTVPLGSDMEMEHYSQAHQVLQSSTRPFSSVPQPCAGASHSRSRTQFINVTALQCAAPDVIHQEPVADARCAVRSEKSFSWAQTIRVVDRLLATHSSGRAMQCVNARNLR